MDSSNADLAIHSLCLSLCWKRREFFDALTGIRSMFMALCESNCASDWRLSHSVPVEECQYIATALLFIVVNVTVLDV